MGAAQLSQHRALGKLALIHGVFNGQPRQIVHFSLPCIAQPAGKQAFWHGIPQPLVGEPDHKIHIKIRRTVGLHSQKLRGKAVITAGRPHQIDRAPLPGAVVVGVHGLFVK